MTFKRKALGALTRAELLEVGKALELDVTTGMRLDEMMDVVAGSKKRGILERILALLSRDTLKSICFAVGISAEGREKQVLVDRILAAERGPDNEDDEGEAEQPQPKAKKVRDEEAAKPEPPVPPKPVQVSLPWQGFPVLEPTPPPVTRAARAPALPPPTMMDAAETASHAGDRVGAGGLRPAEPVAGGDGNPPRVSVTDAITLDVTPRKPRLAWQGMWRKEMALPVPTQVVEIVRPGRAVDRGGELAGIDTRTVEARDVTTLPPNRLIWTNDNLVALQTLLDEKDPTTRDWRYRGKVDLVYIDPPFMVNNDFRADNTIDIDLGGDEEVQVKKEPSLVEVLAYKDTWRQGLDSFLTMLRRRLELLKELLAPTGSIYVHLDWHAVHYVKVLMDEIFGYENFHNEIVWKRTFARSDAQGFNLVHDVLLGYAAGTGTFWNPIMGPHAIEYIRSHYNQIDPKTGRRYQLTSLDSPNPRPNMMYEWKGHASPAMGWRYQLETMRKLDAEGLINYPPNGGRPRFKRFLDDDGMPLQSIWSDISPVNSQATDRLGYPTQKPIALLERIITASCPPSGLVLDCFLGSGTTAEAAERLGRHWIGIDNGKYAVHLARKRLIQLHGQPRPVEKPQYDYVECDKCKNIDRKEKPQKSPGTFNVRPFTVENMGVYQRAEAWQDFQTKRSIYRDEMIKVFGGEPVAHSPLLHGKKGNSWIHVGPLDGPVSSGQVWSIAREAQRTTCKAVTILSADFDTLSGSEKSDISERTAVAVTVRVIPSQAIDEVRRRMELLNRPPDAPIESMAVPAFYAPLSIVLAPKVSGRTVSLKLERCEVDIESFLASQRPVFKAPSDSMSAGARKKAEAEAAKWDERQKVLQKWLAKTNSWQSFVDFWAVDWDYFSRTSPDGKPIF
ncbi:MAG TPA: site-specific DNA-methyltransferase [Polyangia bacterium]|nr:site-specific DNA-methyltransferase [Polyangia bacterium]